MVSQFMWNITPLSNKLLKIFFKNMYTEMKEILQHYSSLHHFKNNEPYIYNKQLTIYNIKLC